VFADEKLADRVRRAMGPLEVEGLPSTFPSPFAPTPHPVAQLAAGSLMDLLRSKGTTLHLPRAGKMFGVLVVRTPDGRAGWIKAFSGMLEGQWEVEGFVPPAFDAAERGQFWPRSEAELAKLDEALRENLGHQAKLDQEHTALREEQAQRLVELQAKHQEWRTRRQLLRKTGAAATALNHESGRATVEERALKRAHRAARLSGEEVLREFENARVHLLHQKRALSRDSVVKMYDSYRFYALSGLKRSLRELFAPGLPPGGAGDCAGPKLLSFARAHQLRPIAMAEFWWGAGPREHGRFYPACSDKCRPILEHCLSE
jgi:tRNA pseudouridine32 synthase/23S rRNA pseudouridine746 synthase